MMRALPESEFPKWGLYCEPCDFYQFASYGEWQVHHLHHLRQPFVRLVKLNPKLSAKLLQGKSYKLNTGVARSSQHHVPPLKISLIKEQGGHTFTVKRKDVAVDLPEERGNDLEDSRRFSGEEFRSKSVERRLSEVEGKDLLERLGASFSISRKGKAPCAGSVKKSAPGDGNGGVGADPKRDNILERLSGIGGISISTVSKCQNAESKSVTGVSISSKAKAIELSQLKTLKPQVFENDKRGFDKNKILEKLSGSGLISIAAKAGVREEGEAGSPKAEGPERLGPTGTRSSRSEDSNDSSDSKMSGDSRTSQVAASEENGRPASESGGTEQKKFVRVKQSSFSKRSVRTERQGSQEEGTEERASGEEVKDRGGMGEERGIDILERLTENLNNTVGIEKPAEGPSSSESSTTATEDPLATDREVNHNKSASESECPEETSDSHFPPAAEKNSQGQDQVQTLMLPPSSSGGLNGGGSNYSTMNQEEQESFGEHENVAAESSEVNENDVSFTSLSNEDQSDCQGEQQTAFWSDIQSTSNNVDQPQEDPLLTPETSVPNGDANFLHNFSNDYQSAGSNLPPENSEFMSLDRLGQSECRDRFRPHSATRRRHPSVEFSAVGSNQSSTLPAQHQHSPYGADQSSPMEHLSQQVQRIPNPTPQINVISQHHLQAPPPPPQLHTGVPLSPQHISPQQANSYDALHMQPPMPPPLYQGYMYNQSYPPQPQLQRPPQPQMPMLQQRPHIPARTFQSMPVPQQRPRPRPAVKRSPIRPPQEMVPSTKQPRMSSLQVRPQVPNQSTKLPSGITITPPKKTLEANKVANVLASRGITVTPSRQTSQSTKQPQPQQQQQQQQHRAPPPASVLNIGSSVSITPNQNRGNGGFAVPGPRRTTPIVNHGAERPERCMTVDLTQDDEFPHSQSRNRRWACNLCGKVFTSSPALATHKAHLHRSSFPFKCDQCAAEYTNMSHLINHRHSCHKKASTPDLAIPIVDLNHPGARDQLRKCGVYNFIPLAQLQSNSNGYFGVPIIQLDTAKEKAVSNLSLLGAGNILVLGKMKAITTQTSH